MVWRLIVFTPFLVFTIRLLVVLNKEFVIIDRIKEKIRVFVANNYYFTGLQ